MPKQIPYTMPPANDVQLRQWARVGALAQVTRAFATFPDLMEVFGVQRAVGMVPARVILTRDFVARFNALTPSEIKSLTARDAGPADGSAEDLAAAYKRVSAKPKRRRRPMSQKGRESIRRNMRARWKKAKHAGKNHL